MTKKLTIIALAAVAAISCGPRNGVHELNLLTTNDVHGTWFDSTYVGGRQRNSLMAMKWYIDSVRAAAGEDNVLLVDAGDCLQGDNAAYYFNYVDTVTPHLFPRLVSYMKYDAVTVGNHDIETGHAVYDRVRRDLEADGIPFMAGNAIKDDDGKPYFTMYKTFRRAGLKVAVLGFTNPNMKAWLDESLFSGMHFDSLLPLVQRDVDEVVAKEKPQVVIVSVHSGTGNGQGDILESQGLDLFSSLRGVDFLICSHDHRPFIAANDSIALINSGSHSRNVGHGTVRVTVKGGKVVGKEISAELIPVRGERADAAMREAFAADYEAVKAFTLKEVGELKSDMATRLSYAGMCDYMNFIHTVCLEGSGAEVSIAAPLTYNGLIPAGKLVYNDLFTIYPYENQLFVIKMTGRELKDYLEYSYDQWIQSPSSGHVLKMEAGSDERFSQHGWHFVQRSYNFDSAAGLNYTVDVTKPFGSRVNITSLTGATLGGSFPFSLDDTYTVVMTSYRASGGGDLLDKGAKIDTDKIDERILTRYPEIRSLVYDYLQRHGSIDPAVTGDKSVIGEWRFVPEEVASKAIASDMQLLFPDRGRLR